MKITRHARFISILLALLMVISSIGVFALEGDDQTAGSNAEAADIVTEEDITEGADIVTDEDFDLESEEAFTLDAATDAGDTEPVTEEPDPVEPEPAAPVLKAFTKIQLTKKYSSKDLEGSKDNGYTLSWKHNNSGVASYKIYRKKSSAKKWTVIKTVSAGTSSLFVLVPSGTYYYKVEAVAKNGGKNVTSSTVKATISGVLTSTDGIKWYCKTKRAATLYKSGSGNAKAGKVKKGAKLYAVGRYPAKVKKFHYATRVQVAKTPNGKAIGWLKWSDLKGGVKGNIIVKKDYTRSLKEQFVNETWNKQTKGKATPVDPASNKRIKKAGSDGILLWACLHTQRVYTFKKSGGKWVLKRSDRITSGKYSQPTRSSEKAKTIFTISKKKPGKVWMVQENGKRYYFTHQAVVTASGVSFHTGTWWESGKVRGVVSKAGTPGTYGCIRVGNSAAVTLFNTVHVNKTAVLITMND